MFPSQGTDSVNHGAEPHWRILVFNFAITFAAGLACGLVPALQATRQILALKPSSSVWLRKALVVRQLSLSLLLLIGAGLFPQSLSNLATFMIDPGLERVQERTGGSVLSGTVSTVEGDVRSGIRAVGSGASAPRWGAGFEDLGQESAQQREEGAVVLFGQGCGEWAYWVGRRSGDEDGHRDYRRSLGHEVRGLLQEGCVSDTAGTLGPCCCQSSSWMSL